jgi:hypothetical protein
VRAALLLIVFAACRSGPRPRADGCIVSAQQASDRYGAGGHYFTPSDRDIRALQATLSDFLSGEDGTERIVQRLARYRGVFVGAMVDGHRVVRASYDCAGNTPCSERLDTISFDGGDCLFEVEFDLETRRYQNLIISGIASAKDHRRRDDNHGRCGS